jgi:hypothetical protein
MNKGLKILIVSLLLVFIILGSAYFFIFNDDVNLAYLTVKKQNVEVNTQGNWLQAEDMELSLSDKVRTTNGNALVLLYESILVDLDENTEVSIESLSEEKVVLNQNSGSVWSKFTGISGIESYEVQTPNSVATVRGTGFLSKVDEGVSQFLVGEGVVEVNTESGTITVNTGEKAVKVDGEELRKQELSEEEKVEIRDYMQQTLNDLKNLRKKEIEKHSSIIDKLMEQYQLTEEDINNFLEQIDSGELNDAELIEKSPVKLDAMYKIKRINDEIKKQISLLETI